MTTREAPTAHAFADQCVRWSARAGAGPQAVAWAGALASRLGAALEAGHSCLLLDAAQTPQALATRIVGTARDPGSCPLVMDAQGRLYLHRHYDDERRLAGRLAELARQGRLLLVTGGPGTGKTSAVAQLLGELLAEKPALRILLAAPTGKAAARLQEALQARGADLPAPVRALLPSSAATVHRVLGQDVRGQVRHRAGHPLPVDVLVIDEASMLDLGLAARVCDALPAPARLVLLGDPDQLAAVESGAVFAELAGLPEPPALQGSVRRLEHSWRFAAGSPIGLVAAAVRRGDEAATLALAGAGNPALQWSEPLAGKRPEDAVLTALEAGFGAYWQALALGAGQEALFAAWAQYRVLCALRAGPWGSEALGGRLDRVARARLDVPAFTGLASPWYRGRPVMVTRNDAQLQLFNGDVGITLPDAQGELQVWFPAPGGAWRTVATVRMPPHETAYAVSVHRSQGSEFDRVAVVLPPDASPVLTRELLYTAVTRARQGLQLFAARERLAEAVNTPTRRASGLRARLEEAVEAQAGAANPSA